MHRARHHLVSDSGLLCSTIIVCNTVIDWGAAFEARLRLEYVSSLLNIVYAFYDIFDFLSSAQGVQTQILPLRHDEIR